MTHNPFSRVKLLDFELLRNRLLLTASIGHMSVDLFSGMSPLILLIQKDALRLSYSQIGLVSMTFSVASSLTQPLFGVLGDRWGHARLTMIGATVIGLAVGGMLAANQYSMLLLLAVIAGLASASFHPQGAVLAAQTSFEKRGSAISIFMLGGNAGFSFGPLLWGILLVLAGGHMPEMLAALGLAFSAVVFFLARGAARSRSARPHAAAPSAPPAALGLIITVVMVVFMRSWVSSAISTFVPQIFKDQGLTPAAAGNVLFAILFPLAIGGLVGGTLSDRVGRRRVLAASTAVIGPAMWAMVHSTGTAAFLVAPVLGLALGASTPVTVVMTQELVPRGLGLMSGIALGLNFVSGAIGVWVTGLAADQIGLVPAMSLNVIMPVAAAALSLLLPPDRVEKSLRKRGPATEDGEAFSPLGEARD